MSAETIPASFLRSVLSYDAETGVLTWKARSREMFSTDFSFVSWNHRCAGKPAMKRVNGDGYHVGDLHYLGRRYTIRAHRAAYAIHYGYWPEHEIDHINGLRNDNRIKNLRVSTREQNIWNARKSGKLATGVKKTAAGFTAQIRTNGKTVNLGNFATERDAFEAYRAAWRRHRDRPMEDWAVRHPSTEGASNVF